MAPRNEPSKATARRLQGLRILLAEDNAINQQVAVELLSAEGALMSVADNGSIAADMAQKAKLPFDAILMDLQMPVMDGFQATAEIKRRLLDSAPPIIAMTANAMSTDRAACLAAGMLDHVGKPFDLDVLVACLLRHIKPRRSRIATPSTTVSTSAPSSEPNASTHFETPIGSKASASANPQLFDPHSAIARLGGSANLYYNILGTFVRDMAGSPQDILAHATAGRIEEAKRAAHTLKGLASTVGAKPLSAAAGLVEAACMANDSSAMLPRSTELVAAMAQTLPLIASALANR
jgi:CheY-like chemotaxis protein